MVEGIDYLMGGSSNPAQTKEPPKIIKEVELNVSYKDCICTMPWCEPQCDVCDHGDPFQYDKNILKVW